MLKPTSARGMRFRSSRRPVIGLIGLKPHPYALPHHLWPGPTGHDQASWLRHEVDQGMAWRFPDGQYSPVVSDGKRVYLMGDSVLYGLVPCGSRSSRCR